jgi:hypothetical protein
MTPLDTRARIDRALQVAAVVGALVAVRYLPACGFKSATGLPCPLCGGTRSAACLMRGDVGGALSWNPWAVAWLVLAAVLAAAWSFEALVGLGIPRPSWLRRSCWATWMILGFLSLALWAARLGGVAFPWPEGAQ